MKLLGIVLTFLVVVMGCASGDDGGGFAATTGGSVVPKDFVPTPGGFMHPSCVIHVAGDERVIASDKIERDDGTIRTVAPCAYPRYDLAGKRHDWRTERDVAPGAPRRRTDLTAQPKSGGWAADEGDLGVSPVGSMSATWSVPSNPSSKGDGSQQVFFFPGLQDSTNGGSTTILQPVLAWTSEKTGGLLGTGLFGGVTGTWTIQSWNCCRDGNAFHGDSANVNQGDTLVGSITSSGCDDNGVCSKWTITTTDTTTRKSVHMDTTSFGQTFDWVLGGVLEVYGISDCSQMPANGAATFDEISASTTAGDDISLAFNLNTATDSGQCQATGTSAAGGEATITWTTSGSGKAGGNDGGAPGPGTKDGGAEGGAYMFAEPSRMNRHHPIQLASGASKTVGFIWRDATGMAAPADLWVEAGGRAILQVSSVGTDPFARALGGVDLVPLDPGAEYALVFKRSGESVRVSLARAGDVGEARGEAPLLEVDVWQPDGPSDAEAEVADVVLPSAPWREAIVSSAE